MAPLQQKSHSEERRSSRKGGGLICSFGIGSMIPLAPGSRIGRTRHAGTVMTTISNGPAGVLVLLGRSAVLPLGSELKMPLCLHSRVGRQYFPLCSHTELVDEHGVLPIDASLRTMLVMRLRGRPLFTTATTTSWSERTGMRVVCIVKVSIKPLCMAISSPISTAAAPAHPISKASPGHTMASLCPCPSRCTPVLAHYYSNTEGGASIPPPTYFDGLCVRYGQLVW